MHEILQIQNLRVILGDLDIKKFFLVNNVEALGHEIGFSDTPNPRVSAYTVSEKIMVIEF